MPNTKSEGPYIFSTDKQLRQDLKKAMAKRGFSCNALAPRLQVTTSTLTRFLGSDSASIRVALRKRVVDWLSNGELPAVEPSAPLAAWLTLQLCLLDIAGRAGELPPAAFDAIAQLNKYFACRSGDQA